MKKAVGIIIPLTVLLIGSCLHENVPSPSGTLSVTECHNGNYKIMKKEYSVNGLMEILRTNKVKKICLTVDKADLGIDNNARLIQFSRENGIEIKVIYPTSSMSDPENEHNRNGFE